MKPFDYGNLHRDHGSHDMIAEYCRLEKVNEAFFRVMLSEERKRMLKEKNALGKLIAFFRIFRYPVAFTAAVRDAPVGWNPLPHRVPSAATEGRASGLVRIGQTGPAREATGHAHRDRGDEEAFPD